MDEVHLEHRVGCLCDVVVVAYVEVTVVDLHRADSRRETVRVDVEGIHCGILDSVVHAVIPLVVRSVADDRRPCPRVTVTRRSAVSQRALKDGVSRKAFCFLQRIRVDRGVFAVSRVQSRVESLLTGVDRHVQISVVLDHLVDGSAVVRVIHMVCGIVEKLLALLSYLFELGIPQGIAFCLDSLEAAVSVEIVSVRSVRDDVRAVHLRDGSDQRSFIDRDSARDREDIRLLHGSVLFHSHCLIDGAELVGLRVDLEDGRDTGSSVSDVLGADLRSDEVEASVVLDRVAESDLIAVDRARHDYLGLAGLHVHLEQHCLRGNRMLGVVVVAVKKTYDAVDHLLVVFLSRFLFFVGSGSLILEQTNRFQHRLSVVLGYTGSAVHRADINPIAVAERGESVGLARVACQAGFNLGEHTAYLFICRGRILDS